MVCTMAGSPGPTMVRRQLAAELRRLRELAHRTVTEVAADLGWSESKLSRIETANTGIRASDLQRLLAAYGTTAAERKRLVALAGQARQRAWWEAYGDALPDAYETYIGFEAEASSIFTYQAQVIPGLLQTAEYANAIMLAGQFWDNPEAMGQRVAVRMARQAVLTRQPPPDLHAVLDEAALTRPIGGPDVLRRQMLRLVELGERPMITIQVLPFTAGAHRGLAGSFVVLEFAGTSEPSLVYSEGMTGGVFRSRPHELRSYLMSFESLKAASLSPTESMKMIAELARREN